jgi:hypothetical protein
MDISGMYESARPILIAFGLKVLGAIAAYIVGRMLIGFASNWSRSRLNGKRSSQLSFATLGRSLPSPSTSFWS